MLYDNLLIFNKIKRKKKKKRNFVTNGWNSNNFILC